MKILYITYFLLSIGVVNTQETTLELTPDNLTLLALKNSSSDVIDAYVKESLVSINSKEYFKIRKQKSKVEAMFNREKQSLIKELSSIPKQQVFFYSKSLKFIPNLSSSSIQINGLFPSIFYPILRTYNINKGMPDYFYLLMVNLEILNKVPVKKTELELLLANQQKNIYVEAQLRVGKYQNQQSFQTVIEKLNVYQDKTKNNLITTLVADKDYQKLSKNWLLSEGFTTNLVGIHAFSVLGYRLQDKIKKSRVLSKNCKKSDRVNGHQVVFCKRRYTQNSMIITIYLGGVLAQMDLIISQGFDSVERDAIINNLNLGLKKPRDFYTGEQKVWEKYRVDFSFYPDSLLLQGSRVDNILQSEYKLVFSMESQATKALFEGK